MSTATQERAGETVEAAGEGARRVADEAMGQARHLASEASTQVRDLVETSRQELRTQADQQARHAAQGLRSWSEQLGALASGHPEQAGQAKQYVQEAQHRLTDIASRVEDRGIDGVLADVSDFARRRPLVFLGAASVAGFVIGRIVRAGASSDGSQRFDQRRTPAIPAAEAQALAPSTGMGSQYAATPGATAGAESFATGMQPPYDAGSGS